MSTVPVLLVTGFLGAGKTTLINHVLAHAGGRRIAAVVNDFGAINIDAELIVGADGVVSLANGCICCSLEGDLLRTLATLLRRTPRPEAIVIETSGVADAADIVRNLMDPVIWAQAPLEMVLCVVDTAAPLDDPLLRSQVRAADIVVVSKADLAIGAGSTHASIRAINARCVIVPAEYGRVSMDLLFPTVPDAPVRRDPGRSGPRADRFESVSWTSEHPVSLTRVQAVIERLAPRLARAKGLLETVERPGCLLALQFAGGRATLATVGAPPPSVPKVRMVFIAEIGALTQGEVGEAMEACI